MTSRLDDYAPFVGRATVDELRFLGDRLRGRIVQHINATASGGGVAEILHRLIPLTCELGVDARWDVLHGNDAFFAATKKLHNGLHGAEVELTLADVHALDDATDANLQRLTLAGDVVVIHDPQPIRLVRARPAGSRWVWRCHVDLSAPNPQVWELLAPWIARYDAAVVSAPQFAHASPVPQFQVPPSIDPLSDKNRELDPTTVARVVEGLGIDPARPLVTQVSRFDRLKDPVGVIDAYRQVRRYNDCQLLLVGGGADDDPEGAAVLAECRERAAGDPDVHIVELPPTAHVEINALQRASTVIVQKSLREGFGLTVAEALWKGKPVVAGAVGGIPLQVTHKYSGVLTRTVEGTAFWIKQLLNAPEFARRLGENGREHVRNNFLLTRQLRDYLLLLLALDHPNESLVIA